MPIIAFDHVNLRTANLDAMVEFYGDVMGMHPGKRPNFSIGGAWLYLGDQPYVHLVDVDDATAGENVTLEHFAFRATHMAEFTDRLEARGIPYSVDPVPGFPIVQVNFRDPDRNHIHVDFDSTEYDG